MTSRPRPNANRYSIPRGDAAHDGIDGEKIEAMVHGFYGRVQRDPLLGPVFEEKIDHEWGPHLEKMQNFWRTVLLAESRYHGNPMSVHRQLRGLTPAHFQRWLALFATTVDEVFAPHAAAVVKAKAQRMARALASASLETRCA